jgi:hypothetical protein
VSRRDRGGGVLGEAEGVGLMVNPKDHPNASAAVIVGYAASAIVYGAKKAGYTLTVEEATTAATALIALFLFLAGKAKTK